ncbi:MAG: signal peptidase I [Candidatus Omnitrophica bacterium]|nr:signal peptidase I [Candidatus Omnitrophota bacterium]
MRARRSSRSSPRSSLRENLESILWAAALALLIRTFIVAPFKIPSGSMRPTLLEGDRILVNKFLYRFREPQHGEVIVFRFPENPKRPFIKRLIAVGGDRVEIRGGRVVINGRPAGSAVVQETTYYNQGEFGQAQHAVEVPEGMYYVLGDNSSSSHDSRFWGFVPQRLLIGKAVCIFWPPKRIRALQ